MNHTCINDYCFHSSNLAGAGCASDYQCFYLFIYFYFIFYFFFGGGCSFVLFLGGGCFGVFFFLFLNDVRGHLSPQSTVTYSEFIVTVIE